MLFLRAFARPLLLAASALGSAALLAVTGLAGASTPGGAGGSYSASELGIEVSNRLGETPAV